jgi:hypothetical protein
MNHAYLLALVLLAACSGDPFTTTRLAAAIQDGGSAGSRPQSGGAAGSLPGAAGAAMGSAGSPSSLGGAAGAGGAGGAAGGAAGAPGGRGGAAAGETSAAGMPSGGASGGPCTLLVKGRINLVEPGCYEWHSPLTVVMCDGVLLRIGGESERQCSLESGVWAPGRIVLVGPAHPGAIFTVQGGP